MSPDIRFKILAGVSTVEQDEEKDSIPNQIETCRRVINQYRGREVGDPATFRASRSGYDSLPEAMQDIPALRDVIEAAERDEYDVLILDNWDRLGDLGTMVLTRYMRYRKQVVSARQSGKIQDPKTYDPYSDESAAIDMHIQGIIQKYRINKMRRGWNVGVPARIEHGLHPLAPPFGYRSFDNSQPAAQIPDETRLILQFKDMLLSGSVYEAITRVAEASGVKPPAARWKWKKQAIPTNRWHTSTIRTMLENPFYAGIIRLRLDPPLYGKGRHVPLWDEATYHAILAEHRRRKELHTYHQARYPLSALVYCWCGSRINRHGADKYKYMSCTAKYSHFSMVYDDAVKMLTGAIVDEFKRFSDSPPAPIDTGTLHQRLDALAGEFEHVREMTRRKIYTLDQGEKEITALENEAEKLKYRIEKANERNAMREQWNREININNLPVMIASGDPEKVNRLLSALIEKIVIENDDITIVWRVP